MCGYGSVQRDMMVPGYEENLEISAGFDREPVELLQGLSDVFITINVIARQAYL